MPEPVVVAFELHETYRGTVFAGNLNMQTASAVVDEVHTPGLPSLDFEFRDVLRNGDHVERLIRGAGLGRHISIITLRSDRDRQTSG